MVRIRFNIPLLAGAFLALAGPALAAPLPVEPVKTDTKADTYDFDVAWPKTGLAAIDDAVGGWVKETVDGFVTQAAQDFAEFKKDNNNQDPPWRYFLSIAYDVPRNDDDLFVASFVETIFTGGAHPNNFPLTYNFLRPDGWQVFLPEIFTAPALERISALAIAELTKTLGGPDSMSDKDWIHTGAGPAWENFEAFQLLPDRLVLLFGPYQVAAYAAGQQTVSIPLSELSGLMRADWRAPVASFDCAKAGTTVEKSICASVPLARLDRKVAAAYRQALSFADGDAGKATVREAQRAWLKQRDQTCPDGAAACLTGVYGARLAALSGDGG